MILLRFIFLIYLTHATYLYFDRNSYEIFVSESTPIHSKITTIQAQYSPLLSIEYELHGDTNKTFYLNSLTGDLILLKSLDYETISKYKLTIEASSSSSIAPCLSELIIHILNINDHSPQINLMIYPSILYESNIIKYDLDNYSTSFATINIKDLDPSTTNLTLSINDTKHFQIQLIRQMKNDLIYILSTKNNSQLIHHDYYYLLLQSCDNDQPLLCTNQSYRFHFKSTEYLCQLSFEQKYYIIDIKEHFPIKTCLMHKITNQFCQNITYSIDDINNFYVDSLTGDLFTLKKFNRTEQSLYKIYLFIKNTIQIEILIRILDSYGNIPFLIKKNLITNQNQFSNINLFHSTSCRAQIILENYFQLFSNCTIISLIKPPIGRYLFNIELNQRIKYQDTFLLELKDEDNEERLLTFTQPWIIIIPSLLGILFALGTIIGTLFVIKQKRSKLNQLCSYKQKASSLSINESNESEKSYCYRSDINSKLRVHDDHDLSSSPTSTVIYLIQKPSPPLSSLTPIRDDEGYSGSSDVSENHQPYESTIISANNLLEQYRIHQFHHQPLYDVPRRHIDTINEHCNTPDASLV